MMLKIVWDLFHGIGVIRKSWVVGGIGTGRKRRRERRLRSTYRVGMSPNILIPICN